jgi:bifunctional non-homologous end joining protein LigD
VAVSLPIIKAPMAATEVRRPFHHPGWVYEEKVDGWRVLAYKNADGVRLISRNGRELTRRLSELAAAVADLEPSTLVLDGEIAVFDRQLVSHFEWLRRRPKDETTTPPLLMAFDCLYARGKDLRKRPLRVRRNVLEELVGGQQLVLPARRLAADGLEAWAQVLERGYEGMVGKDEASAYVEGRTFSWLRVKQPRYREGERGWAPGNKS